MTGGSFSVLLVEEDADERHRIRQKLVAEFVGAAVIEVASADDLERALEGNESDVAVVDLGLSWSTGREVFRGVRARWPDVPVIMLTPDGDEEGTADAIEAGLDDLVPRSRIGVWLGPSIRAAIARGEHLRAAREAEQATRDAVSVLESTLEATADGILVVDMEGRIVTFNQRFAQMWRIPLALLKSRDDDRAIAHVLSQLADPDAFVRKVRELYGKHNAESFDVLEFKDGRVFERNSLPQRLEGRAIGRVWSFRDVTERRRAEAGARRDAMLMDQLQEAVVSVDLELGIRSWNRAAERIFGWTTEEAVGRNVLELLHPEPVGGEFDGCFGRSCRVRRGAVRRSCGSRPGIPCAFW